jgi:soluble lytic murein transglycosylase-like protein
MVSRHLALGCVFAAVSLPTAAADATDRAAIEALITKHAKANGVPVSLVHRVVRRESNYNPRAYHRDNLGLMQIRHGTARGMGYTGSAAGLLDADTNLSYAVPYLANAYRVAGGNENRAVSLYASGFYYHAKRKGMIGSLKKGPLGGEPEPGAQIAQVPAQPGLGSWLASVFSRPATQPQQAASVQDDAPVGRKRRSKWSHIATAASSR